MSKFTGLPTDFHKMAILFDLLFEVKSAAFDRDLPTKKTLIGP